MLDWLNRRIWATALLLPIAAGCQPPVASSPSVSTTEEGSSAASPTSDTRAATAPISLTIDLTIDYHDGSQKRYPAIPWHSGMTVRDALTWVAQHPRGVTWSQQGEGEMSFLSQIEDLNGHGVGQKNWIYRVNGKLADCSFAAQPLQPGDAVLWEFAEYR